MSTKRASAYIIAALVAGLVLGSIGLASAAPVADGTAETGMGIRLGATIRSAGATLADVVAKLTDSSVEDVRAKRAEGTSLAAIASDAGVSAETVVSETLKARKEVLDDAVADEKITQDQADAALDRMETRLEDRVASTEACTGDGTGGGRKGQGGGMGRGQGGGMGQGRGQGGGCGMGQGAGACGNCTVAD